MGSCLLLPGLLVALLLVGRTGVRAQGEDTACSCNGRAFGSTVDPCAQACSASFCLCALDGTCSRLSCGVGSVFSPESSSCEPTSSVEGCRKLPRSLGPASAPSPLADAPILPPTPAAAPVSAPVSAPVPAPCNPREGTCSGAVSEPPSVNFTDGGTPRGVGSADIAPSQSASFAGVPPLSAKDAGDVGTLPPTPLGGGTTFSTGVKVAVSAAVISLVLLVFCVIGIFCGRKLARIVYCGKSPTDFQHAKWTGEGGEKGSPQGKKAKPVVPAKKAKAPKALSVPVALSFKDIQRATGGFDELNFLGEGGFGTVYFGRLANGRAIAVKRASEKSSETELQFKNEVRVLSSMQHENLVQLVGYCEEEEELLLVYDYCSNGPLTPHLLGAGAALQWEQRLNIALGAAKGLEHLHTGGGAGKSWIHRDVKADNLLLDENWDAKVTDVGFSRLPPRDMADLKRLPSTVKGTLGYVDPDYRAGNSLTTKSDVWSFGIVLLQLLSGRPAIDMQLPPEKRICLVDWAKPYLRDRKYTPLVDPQLGGRYSVESLVHIATLAARCTQRIPQLRPTMTDVVRELQRVVDQEREVPLDDPPIEDEFDCRDDVNDWGMTGISFDGRGAGGSVAMTPNHSWANAWKGDKRGRGVT